MRSNPFGNGKDVLTTGEVAKICNVAARTVSKWIDSGRLEGYRIPGSKDRRVPVATLLGFMKKHNIPLDGFMSGAPRVLVVDADQETAATLRKVLSEQTRFEVRTSATAFTAGVECERFRPHVVLVDESIGTREMEAFAAQVRQGEDLAGTRLVATGARFVDGDEARYARLGFDRILRKPYTARSVVEAIERSHAVAC
ncbi:MAG: excisionase family DNA-binding protein [Phycisphaerales bacterium]